MSDLLANLPRRWEPWLVAAGFLALTLGWTYPLVHYLGRSLPELGDSLLNAWILAWDADRLGHGLRGLWDAPIFFPYARTLAYSEHLLGIALLFAPVQWIADNPLLLYNTAFLFSYVLAGTGMYVLARSLCGRRDAALLAGLAFAFCPYRTAQLPHLQVLMSGWMPISLWALHGYFASGSRRMLAGFVVAYLLQALSNGYFLYFLAVPVALVSAQALAHGRPSRRTFTDLVSAGVIMLVCLAPVASVYYAVQQEQGFRRQTAEIASYSADVGSYLHVDQVVSAWRWESSPFLESPSGMGETPRL